MCDCCATADYRTMQDARNEVRDPAELAAIFVVACCISIFALLVELWEMLCDCCDWVSNMLWSLFFKVGIIRLKQREVPHNPHRLHAIDSHDI